MKKHILISALAGSLALAGVGMAMAADQVQTKDRLHTTDKDALQIKDKLQDKDQDRLMDRDQIYLGSLMTPAERAAYLERLRLAKTEQEREQIRAQHRIQMEAIAKEKGVSIPTRSMGASSPGAANSNSGSTSGGSTSSGTGASQGANSNAPGNGKK